MTGNGSPDLLRIGFIGAGRLASRIVYPTLRYAPVQLVAVCDLDRDRAEVAAQKFGASRTYTDYRELIADPEVDAVVAVIGPEQHVEIALAAMEAKKPVYTEKPPAASFTDTRRLLDASRESGVICMTGFKKRFAPVYRKVKEAAESPEFGGVSIFGFDYACGAGTYTNTPGQGRTWFLIDFCIHVLDASRFMFGDVQEVSARKLDEVAYAVTLEYTSGALGVFALSANRNSRIGLERLEVTGGPGQYLTVDNSSEYLRFSGDRVVDYHKPNFSMSIGDSLIETGFQGEMAEFVDAVREGRTPESSIESAHETMRLIEAVRRSASERRSVQMSEVKE